MSKKSVMILDHHLDQVVGLSTILKTEYLVSVCANMKEAEAAIKEGGKFAVVMVNNYFADTSIDKVYKEIQALLPTSQVIVYLPSRLLNPEMTTGLVKLIQKGVYDVAYQPFHPSDIFWMVGNAIEYQKKKKKLEKAGVDTKKAPKKKTKKNILIVEDEEHVRKSYKELLSRKYKIHDVDSGESALACLKEEAGMDLILLDVGLPDISGDELIKKIKVTHPESPIVMLTAYQDVELLVSTIKKGAVDFVLKSSDRNMLLLKIEKALNLITETSS